MSLFSLLPQKPGKEQQGVAVANRSLRTFLLNLGSTEPAAWSPDLGRLLSTLNSLSKGADGRLFFQMKPSWSQGAHRAAPLQIPACSWWSGQAVESHMPAASASPLPNYLDPAYQSEPPRLHRLQALTRLGFGECMEGPANLLRW